MDHKQLFRDHVTSTAFNLSLSRNMIICLTNVADESIGTREQFQAFRTYDTTVPTRQALEKRGLIKRHPLSNGGFGWSLTDAGAHVFELLKLAGLVTVIREAREAA